MRRNLWTRIFVMTVVCCVVLSGFAFASEIEYTDRETVVAVQEALNKVGYNCGTPDGIAGNRTAEAIRNYQKAHDLTVTGTITEELLKELGIAEPDEETTNGSRNKSIEESAEELLEEDSEASFFTPMFLNALENSAEEWVTGEYIRALATATLVVDLSIANVASAEELTFAAMKTSYIGRIGSDLLFYLHGNQRDLFVLYESDTNNAFYQFMDATDDSILEASLEAVFTDGCYQNNPETVISILKFMMQSIE